MNQQPPINEQRYAVDRHLAWPQRVVPVLHAIVGAVFFLFFWAIILWFLLRDSALAAPLDWCFDMYCHRMPQRSLPWQGEVLPVCARCTGVVAGYLLGAVLALAGAERWPIWRVPAACVLLSVMGLSWLGGKFELLQETWHWERVISGFCGGLGGYIFIARVAVLVLNWLVARSRRRLQIESEPPLTSPEPQHE